MAKDPRKAPTFNQFAAALRHAYEQGISDGVSKTVSAYIFFPDAVAFRWIEKLYGPVDNTKVKLKYFKVTVKP